MYFWNEHSVGTENNYIRDIEPVVIMVSDTSHDVINPGYGDGMETERISSFVK